MIRFFKNGLIVSSKGEIADSMIQHEPTKLGMQCEHHNCHATETKDYKRSLFARLFDKNWGKEPIALCSKHSLGRKLFNEQRDIATEIWWEISHLPLNEFLEKFERGYKIYRKQ